MGYISSGDTEYTVVYLTQTGRELLLKGDKNRFKITYFALGDSDINYNIESFLDEGFVSDLTGNNDRCVVPMGINIDIKNKIIK